MRAILCLFALISLPAVPSAVIAHGGGLDAKGCHSNRKTGDYHCHRAQTRPARPSKSRNGEVYYARCDDARAAGVAPIYRGQPGYRPALDRDNDGVACEPYRRR